MLISEPRETTAKMLALPHMPLTDADKNWIRGQLGKRNRVLAWIKEWASPAVAVVILLFIWSEYGTYVEFRTQTKDRLESIEKKLIAADLQKLSALPQANFDKSLPELRSSLAEARRQGLRVSPVVLNDLQNRMLATGSGAPDFWATTAEFVSYRSLAEHQHAIAASANPSSENTKTWSAAYTLLPDCVESLPKPMIVKEVLSETQLVPSRALYEKCRFALDSQRQDQVLNTLLSGGTPLLTFRDCLIEYHGGEIHLILAWDKAPFTWRLKSPSGEDKQVFNATVSGPSIQFENCIFNFTLQGPPSENGQRLSALLLAENTESFALPVAR